MAALPACGWGRQATCRPPWPWRRRPSHGGRGRGPFHPGPQASPYIGSLEPPLAKELVRKLNAPAFQAPQALLGALARTDPLTGEPSGLLKAGGAGRAGGQAGHCGLRPLKGRVF